VHRDLKPSNVLVTDTDGGPLPKLLDFGIAKVIGDQAPGLTQTGERWMTPEYAAPEQVKSEAVTTATDIYQLGVVLYELLSGRRPFRSRERSIYEIEQAVCDERPRPPSSVVTQAPPDPEAVGHARRTDPARLRRTLQGDLDAIVMKALRKEPDERYPSAEAMVEDVRRYLEGRPVTAHRGTWTYRMRKFTRRHATGVATALAVVILALAFGIYHTQRLTAERDRAQEASETSAAVSGFMVDLFESANPAVTDGDTPTPADLLERGTERLDDLGDRPAVQAAMLRAMGRSYVGLGQYNRADSLLHRSLQLQQAATGPGSPGTVAALEALGNSKRTAQRPDSARYYLKKALRIHERQPQPDPEQTVQLLTFLGQTQRDAGNLDAAEASVRRAISLYESRRLDRPETLANARSILAYVLRGQGKLDEAEALYRTILAGKERPDNDLALAKTLNNLAYLLHEREAYGEAEALYREALSISRNIKGANHPESLMLLSNLAGTTHEQGKVGETEQLLREKAELSRQRYGDTHWRVGSALVSGVGRLLMENDECDRARSVLREGLQIWADGLGPAHPWTARARGMLGICLAHSDAPGDASDSDASAGDDALTRSRRDLRAAMDRGSSALSPFHLRDLRDLSEAYNLPTHAAAFDTLLANANRSNQPG
jgi:serine/threonine-protein kinase